MYSEILDFLLRHWQLSSIFFILLVAYIIFELRFADSGEGVSPQQVVALYNREQAVILDVRGQDSFTQGHIIGAMHMLPSEIDAKVKKLSKFSKKPIIVVCSVGRDSPKVVQKLKNKVLREYYCW